MKKLKDRYTKQVDVEEVLLDASNIPEFEQARMEGKRELPISKRSIFMVGGLFVAITIIFGWQIFSLQIVHGDEYKAIADRNSVDRAVIIAERGVIYDRRGEMLAWNEVDESGEYDFPIRAYTDRAGLGQVLGYVSYPKKDSRGNFFRTDYVGRSGVELAYDNLLKGENGSKIVQVDALSDVVSQYAIDAPKSGKKITLSIDAGLSEAMYDIIATSTDQADFRSGAGAIMDVHTGEIIALTSFPSFDPEVMADGDNVALINEYNNNPRLPFLNKVIGGAYTPGSIVKPFVAYAALENHIITPETKITSNGSITIPNPYNPSHPSRFNDWRPQGEMTVREGIAFSSNVFFYIVGGGLPKIAIPQAGLTKPFKGLGITKLAANFHRFGLGKKTGIPIAQEQAGVVPDPAWKKKVFNDDWRLGDTYFTSIGQFGFLVTPIQMLRAYGALANGGTLVSPHVIKGQVGEKIDLHLDPDILQVVHEGMRKTVVMNGGTARGLERSDVAVAAKSGTAEIGAGNAYVNSWAAGFWPYEDPQYAFILMMDHAPRSNRLGATTIMGKVLAWMAKNRPEYLGLEAENLSKEDTESVIKQ